MKEENIDKRIERVIRSVASKKEDIVAWNTEEKFRKQRNKKFRMYEIGAVASVAVLGIVGIRYLSNTDDNQGVEHPQSFDYSAKSSFPVDASRNSDLNEIECLIESKRYEEAIDAIDAILVDTIIDTTLPLDTQQEIKSLHEKQGYILQWLKIKSLQKSGKESEAIEHLNQFVLKDGIYKDEAQRILRNLKK